MSSKKKKTLGRGMAELVDGSFSSMVEPARAKPSPGPPPSPTSTSHAGTAAPPGQTTGPARVTREPISAPARNVTSGPGAARRPEASPEPGITSRPEAGGTQDAAAAAGKPPSAAQTLPSRAEPAARAATAPRPAPASSGREPVLSPDRLGPASDTSAREERTLDVISVASGKGGTGKSVIAANLAVLLAGSENVTVLDADLGLANIHILYNLMPRHNASEVISGAMTLEQVMVTGPRGVKVIPGGSGIPELATLTDMMFGSLASGFAALDQSSDLLLIDTPSGIDRQSLIFLMASDQVMVVTTEEITAMTDAYAVVKTVLSHRPSATVVMVVNQARSYADGVETFQKVAHVARKFLGRELALGGIIPFDETVEHSVFERVPVVIAHPNAPASRAMAAIAGRIGAFHARAPRSGLPFTARLKGLLAGPPGA